MSATAVTCAIGGCLQVTGGGGAFPVLVLCDHCCFSFSENVCAFQGTEAACDLPDFKETIE